MATHLTARLVWHDNAWDGCICQNQRASKAVGRPAAEPDWVAVLTTRFGPPCSEREQSAFDEKRHALRTLFGREVSVLTGGAGTGKTSVLQAATTLSREMIYTGLTRFRTRLVLMIEKDVAPLLNLRNPAASDTERRNTQMFKSALRPDGLGAFHPVGLVHRTKKGVAVRSKSEVIVADTLDGLGISYEYEKPLSPPGDPRNFRLPDFTVGYQGDVFYWEHLGMLNVPAYHDAWEKKLAWYRSRGFVDQLITSEDAPNGGIDASEIQRLARERILSGPTA
ncbi:MAG: hypothetical protein SGJ26_10885 [Nitrospirota bacterium]|nr:hypothetical protein [Nitrospirota bacterium]